jgi:hypothetical protein
LNHHFGQRYADCFTANLMPKPAEGPEAIEPLVLSSTKRIFLTMRVIAIFPKQGFIPQIIRVAGGRQGGDKFVRNEFAQPKVASGEGQECSSLIPSNIDNDVTGVSDKSVWNRFKRRLAVARKGGAHG